jgi:all-trans-8'-apo-beta-carotenal 15,15'-oxygenase
LFSFDIAPALQCEHWLDGDGYTMAFTFEGGSGGCVSFRSRYVSTPERTAEQKAGKVLYRNTFGTQPKGVNFGNIGLKNPANTNVVRLLNLASPPFPYQFFICPALSGL